jgi:probable phosphoglycerate mutase
MRRILLVRHGNTFEDGAPVVRVGARSDLPLTAKGLAQAKAFADAVRAANIAVGPFLAGPLARTRTFVTHGFGVRPREDDRLREIDYGTWEGLTDAQIAAAVGADVLEAWNRRCVWPAGQGWSPDADALERGAAALLDELAAGDAAFVPVLCSSQGILRYFVRRDASWFADALTQGRLGVGTGNCCGMECGRDGARVAFWNAKPDAQTLRDWMRA